MSSYRAIRANYEHLQQEGYVVVDVLSSEQVQYYREAIRQDLAFDPYFKFTPDVLTMGGFAALATPHSFHIQPVRKLCSFIDQNVAPKVFHEYLKTPGNLIAQHKDRTLHRTPSQTPSKESWHRDESPGNDKGVIFGGWVNLSTTSDTMSLCPRTHSPSGSLEDSSNGFATIPKEQHAHYKSISKRVEVKPGQWILFYENIVHEVFAPTPKVRKQRGLLTRLFVGYELTTRTTVLDPNLMDTLKNLQTPRIKSGQQPRVYSRMHALFHLDKVVDWSLNVQDRHCFQHTVKSGQRKGQVFRIAKPCPSRDGFPSLCEPYTEQELAMFVPHTYPQEFPESQESEESQESPTKRQRIL